MEYGDGQAGLCMDRCMGRCMALVAGQAGPCIVRCMYGAWGWVVVVMLDDVAPCHITIGVVNKGRHVTLHYFVC